MVGEDLAGPLPEVQPGALPQLWNLFISVRQWQLLRAGSPTPSAPQPGSCQGTLPASWAGLPRLQTLHLSGASLQGQIPLAWLHPGSFPALTEL